MLTQLDLTKAQQRCADHAVEHGLAPPARLATEDGNLSDEAKQFRQDSGLTLDWMLFGEGSKYRWATA